MAAAGLLESLGIIAATAAVTGIIWLATKRGVAAIEFPPSPSMWGDYPSLPEELSRSANFSEGGRSRGNTDRLGSHEAAHTCRPKLM